VHSRFRCHGSPLNSKEIFRLCKGNSRLMFAAAFSFVGPSRSGSARRGSTCRWRR
jgi:hypothetical protein